MEKQQLAKELRKRLAKKGLVERPLLDSITDEQIIESYLTCSCCGKKQVTDQEVATALQFAANADQFFAICDKYTSARPH